MFGVGIDETLLAEYWFERADVPEKELNVWEA